MPSAPLQLQPTGQGTAHGTCGELAQGVLPDGRRFHVTCPIERSTQVTVALAPASAMSVAGVPDGRERLGQALLLAAERLELPPTAITVTAHASALGVAQGMASSTADIVAAIRAMTAAAATELPPAVIAGLAASIEPTDGVMYDGICAADRDTGQLIRRWTSWPQFAITMVTPAETLATAAVQFDGQARLAGTYAALLTQLDEAMEGRDPGAVAAVATRSARLNQTFVASAVLPALEASIGDSGALGLCVGHTGTVSGLLFAADADGLASAHRAARLLRERVPAGAELTVELTPPSPGDSRPAPELAAMGAH